MTNYELGEKLGRLIREERQITNEILQLINLAQERRSYVELGFSSMFDWLVRGFGFANASAYRRIEAAKLLKSVPQTVEKLESGQVNLSTLSQAQKAIKVQEKSTGKKLSFETKTEIVQRIENKSSEEADRVLMELLPENKSQVRREKRVVIDQNTIRYSMNFTSEMKADLTRAKEVLSHKLPDASDADVLAYSLRFLLERLDPVKRSTSAAEARRVTNAGTRRAVLKLSNGICTYQDPLTGQKCQSQYQVQIDHIQPRALGGKDEFDNLRPLCRKHNIFMAEKVFGKERMEKYQRDEKE